MSSNCDACLFYECIVFRYLLVGKIAIMANADYVVDLKTVGWLLVLDLTAL